MTMSPPAEAALMADADARAAAYLAGVATRRVFPEATAIANLSLFEEALPETGCTPPGNPRPAGRDRLAGHDGVERAELFRLRDRRFATGLGGG